MSLKLEDYDNTLFNKFQKEYSQKYKKNFSNKRLFNSWGRKCNFIINFFRNLMSRESQKEEIKNAINILLIFITEKNKKFDLQYLSSFQNDTFKNFFHEMLEFRNRIAVSFFKLILRNEDEKKNEIKLPIFTVIGEIIDDYLKDQFQFLKCLFDLLKYCLDVNVNIYEEFILLLNNDDIITYIIKNKKCTLNTKQIEFIKTQKIELEKSIPFFDKLKSITISIDEIISEYNTIKPKSKTKKKSKKKEVENKTSVDIPNSTNFQEIKEEGKKPVNEENNLNNNNHIINKKLEESNVTLYNVNEKEKVKNLNLIKKLEKMEKENQSLNQKIINLEKNLEKEKEERMKQLINLEKHVINLEKNLEKEKEDRIQENDNLQNKIDVCECKIGMICYRDLIKDIINYSFDYFKFSKDDDDYLSKKVFKLKRIISISNNDITLSLKEKQIFSNFIYSSFLALKNVNYNVHEGGYVSNYSIPNFIECLQNYLELYEYEMMKNKNKKFVNEIKRMIQNPVDIENILKK